MEPVSNIKLNSSFEEPIFILIVNKYCEIKSISPDSENIFGVVRLLL